MCCNMCCSIHVQHVYTWNIFSDMRTTPTPETRFFFPPCATHFQRYETYFQRHEPHFQRLSVCNMCCNMCCSIHVQHFYTSNIFWDICTTPTPETRCFFSPCATHSRVKQCFFLMIHSFWWKNVFHAWMHLTKNVRMCERVAHDLTSHQCIAWVMTHCTANVIWVHDRRWRRPIWCLK